MPSPDRDKRLAKSKAWYEANKDKVKAYAKKWRKTDKGKAHSRSRIRKRKYGLDHDAYWNLAASQSNLCAICHQPEVVKQKGEVISLSVDHDHDTGQVRELLCCRCNSIIGRADDNIVLLEACIRYIQKHKR